MPLRDPDAYRPPKPPRRPVVWGFPKGYNPNRMGDRCDTCHRTDNWQGRNVPGQPFNAWTCRCSSQPQEIPLD